MNMEQPPKIKNIFEDIPFEICPICEETVYLMYDVKKLIINGHQLDDICLECYQNMMDTTLHMNETCPKCDENSLITENKNINIFINNKQGKIYKEFSYCTTCQHTFINAHQKMMNEYRKKLIKSLLKKYKKSIDMTLKIENLFTEGRIYCA